MLLVHILGASPYGGVIPYIDALMSGSGSMGFEHCVVANDPAVVNHFDHAGVRTLNIPSFRREINPPADLLALVNLGSALRGLKPDVVHTHTSKGGFIGRLAAKVAGVQAVVHTVHGFAFHQFSPPLQRWAYSWLERSVAPCCDMMISVNSIDARTAIDYRIVAPPRIVVIPNGINPEPFLGLKPDAELKDELGLPPSSPMVTFVGRLAPQKSVSTLISAMPKVLQHCPKARFVIVGNGPLMEPLRRLASELGVLETTSFLGFRNDVKRILATSDVFVLPSLWEGLPISLLEAMACGLPVVVSDSKGNNEVVRDEVNGLLFRPLDAAELAEQTIRLLTDTNLSDRLRREAQATAVSEFNESGMVAKTMDVYRTLLTRRSGVEGGHGCG